ELLLPEGCEAPATLVPGAVRTSLPRPLFDTARAAERLREATGTASLRGLGVEDLHAGCAAAGAALAYCERSRIAVDGGWLRVRLVGRCVQRLASPRDLAAVRAACEALPRVAAATPAGGGAVLAAAAAGCAAPEGLAERLAAVLVDDPPAHARDGGAVRPGADPELDDLLAAGEGARAYIAGLEEEERRRTRIRSLRVGYNRVFGYYLEVPNAHRDLVPADYVRKQTLVGAERYITPALKEQETIVLGVRERAVAR